MIGALRHCSHPLSAFVLTALLITAVPKLCTSGSHVWTGAAPRAKSIEAIARDPLNPSRAWAGAFGSGVWRTVDGGATWTPSRAGLLNTFVRCLAVEPRHPDSVFAGTNDGVFLSTNGGTTWSLVLATTNSVRSLSIHPLRTGVVYAGTYGSGIYKSSNGGSSWAAVNLGLVNTNVRDVAIHPTNPETLLAATGTGGGIHRSFNGGLTWSQVPDTIANRGAAEQVQYDRLDPSRVYVAELDRGVLRSVDGGSTWARVNGGLTTLRSRSLAVVDTVRYLGTDGQGVFYTTLHDAIWHPVNNGVTSLVVDALSATATSPFGCWAGTDGGGIFSTSDAGASWSVLDGGLRSTIGFSIAVRPSTHEVYLGTGFGDQFWASADQGVNWSRAVTLTPHDSEHGVLADPVQASRVYLTSYGAGVFRSDDGGASWTDPDLGRSLTNRFVRDVVAWPGQSGHLLVGTGDGPFESPDAGATWVSRRGNLPAGMSVRALAIVPGDPSTFYVGSDSSGVWRSTDAGATWVQSNAGLPIVPTLFIHALHVDATNSLVVFAATDFGVYRTANGGAAWLPASGGLPAGDVLAIAQDPVHPDALFCAVYGAGVFESIDQGSSWFSLFGQAGLTDRRVRSLAVDGQLVTLYAGTEDGVASLSNYPTSVVGLEDIAKPTPRLLSWPNPVRLGAVRVGFTLSRPGRVRVAAYDVAGQCVHLFEDRDEPAGMHTLVWNPDDSGPGSLPPGVYLLRLDGPDGSRVGRITVVGR